jgi:hypothetical protein
MQPETKNPAAPVCEAGSAAGVGTSVSNIRASSLLKITDCLPIATALLGGAV